MTANTAQPAQNRIRRNRPGCVRERGVQLYLDLAPQTEAGESSTSMVAHADPTEHLDRESRGAVFTRAEVVEFILDLAGYTANAAVHTRRVLEPSFGEGAFLMPLVKRLLAAWRQRSRDTNPVTALRNALRGVELHRRTYTRTLEAVVSLLELEGLETPASVQLARSWLVCGDFLTMPIDGSFDFVIGNPPYVRQERLSPDHLAEYRRRYATMFDRADLYVPFLERSLSLLSEGGCLATICADRWMKNRYGGPLRSLVAEQFHLRIYVDMVGTQAFDSDVTAYPAITVIAKEPPGRTRTAHRPPIDRPTLGSLAKALRVGDTPQHSMDVRELALVANGAEPWLLGSDDQMKVLRRIEGCFPSIEEAGCKVGIGVATGADRAFIGPYASLDIESDRKLPLVTTRDIASGDVQWSGLGVVNPFEDCGGLVDLAAYPRLHRYLENHRDEIAGRHCARKTPTNWYRTIDRITPSLALRPKLLIPDIKGESHVVFEEGKLYPHHNLYYVTATEWELRALQAVLLSSLSRLFVASYSTAMRGGFLRFQAQYLRRLRIPLWDSVPRRLRQELAQAATHRDLGACNRAVFKLYGMDADERAAIGGNGG